MRESGGQRQNWIAETAKRAWNVVQDKAWLSEYEKQTNDEGGGENHINLKPEVRIYWKQNFAPKPNNLGAFGDN